MTPTSGHEPTRLLAELPLGARAKVHRILLEGPERRRLMDLGLTPGTCVEPVLRSPLGDPTAYRVRGTVLALRNEQAKRIEVTECTS
jgi:ferrous iron transport protein A